MYLYISLYNYIFCQCWLRVIMILLRAFNIHDSKICSEFVDKKREGIPFIIFADHGQIIAMLKNKF